MNNKQDTGLNLALPPIPYSIAAVMDDLRRFECDCGDATSIRSNKGFIAKLFGNFVSDLARLDKAASALYFRASESEGAGDRFSAADDRRLADMFTALAQDLRKRNFEMTDELASAITQYEQAHRAADEVARRRDATALREAEGDSALAVPISSLMALRIIDFFAPPEKREDIIDDLQERFPQVFNGDATFKDRIVVFCDIARSITAFVRHDLFIRWAQIYGAVQKLRNWIKKKMN